ncbi:ABC transporter ATP-binding protein [Pseudonocardia nigra]|uniref:ABC transporter ATP-binding protein n=1 Tax=Pseudonocardia nigra TaxID=1921578 RepID=UPI001C5DF6F2|nr:ABC transporter ATP-binding protein [Pseudonocardia nigra]
MHAAKTQRAGTGREVGDVVLEVQELEVGVRTHGQGAGPSIIRDVSFSLRAQEVVAVVGESGSGKSTLCHAVVDLLADNLTITAGTVRVGGGKDLTTASPAELRRSRGREVGMVFQDPLAALNPVRRIGAQLAEARILHGVENRSQAMQWARKQLAALGFDDPDAVLRAYPHMLSGGMRQRVCVAIAFSADPKVVIADEPTTSLDVSLQGRLLQLLLAEMSAVGSGLLLVSHDIAVVRAMADSIIVMYGGRMLERGPAAQLLTRPRSPYTRALLDALPSLDRGTRGAPLPTITGGSDGGTGTGCPFRSRCPNALDRCAEFPPEDRDGAEHSYWCWNPGR